MLKFTQMKIKAELLRETGAERRGALERLLTEQICRGLGIPREQLRSLEILRESVDARRKPELFYIYTVEAEVANETAVWKRISAPRSKCRLNVQHTVRENYRFPEPGSGTLTAPIVIVGTGPAGLFCGYYLAKHGYRPILLERGKDVDARQRDVETFWETGRLDPASNVQFGEGGAGTFSDGKLNTLVKDTGGRNREVLRTFVEFGAGEGILYEAKPHIGTDVLRGIVKRMREEIIRLGGEVRFESCVTDLRTESDGKTEMDGRCVSAVRINGGEWLSCGALVLAIGHSARDTFSMLYENQIPMEAKSFAVGLRVEHPQRMINENQYGCAEPGVLSAAPYKVTARAQDGRGVYSFCMCPGGYVVNASSEEGRLAVNGMSYSGRKGENANSAVIVSVTPEDYGSAHPLAGVTFQRELERRAYALADGHIPMQRFGVFRACVESGKPQAELEETIDKNTGMFIVKKEGVTQGDRVAPEHKGLSAWADVSRILPETCNRAFVQGMEQFGRQIHGFDRADAILSGVESRTSSPVRILRDESLQCAAVRGLYPCGEGAGYAGGITSAAMDGLRIAERIAATYAPVR